MPDSQPLAGKGRKVCPQCDAVTGVRAYNCKACNYPFPMKKPRKGRRKVRVDNFKDLQKGDKIKVVGSSGPYYTDDSGMRHYLVDRGKYTVLKTDSKGVIAIGEHGFSYLYMGNTCSGLVPSITKKACKLLLFVGKTSQK